MGMQYSTCYLVLSREDLKVPIVFSQDFDVSY
jgi:hypothetical protein